MGDVVKFNNTGGKQNGARVGGRNSGGKKMLKAAEDKRGEKFMRKRGEKLMRRRGWGRGAEDCRPTLSRTIS